LHSKFVLDIHPKFGYPCCGRIVTDVWTTVALFVFDITTIVLHDLSPIGTGNHTVSARRGFRILLGFRLTDYVVLFFFFLMFC